MEKAKEKISGYINENLIQMVFSNSKPQATAQKVKIRPVILKEKLFFQMTSYVKEKVYHQNYEKEELQYRLEDLLTDYKQVQIKSRGEECSILISKKLVSNIKVKKNKEKVEATVMEHNRTKKYILEEGVFVPFLYDLKVMTKDGAVIKQKYDKFRQINRYLEMVEDVLEYLPKNRVVNILDFGCGKSYLTFALYYDLKVLHKYEVNIIGLDLKEDVIKHCNELSKKYGYEDSLKFYKGDIKDYEDADKVDMVVTLHACDTATDYALYKAVNWGAKVILSVPCCQHEANGQIKQKVLTPILEYGILKERVSALVTDGLRANLLEQHGYRTQILEFIDMEHTPKNLMIRAVKDISTMKNVPKKKKEYDELSEFLNLDLTLERLFKREQE